jgi:hypothetical protein
MKIVRAMKECSRLSGEIKEIKHRLERCLSTVETNEFSEDFLSLHKDLGDRVTKLIRLKSAIMKVNVENNMFQHILRLGELKHYLVFLKELNPKSGKQEARFSDNPLVYKSQISVKEKAETIQKTQEEINQITDLLDDFNAKTNIGEVEEIALNMPIFKSSPE